MSLEYPASGEKQDQQEPVLVQNLGHVDGDIHISALDVFYEMDGRESRYIREVLNWCRKGDVGDLRRSGLNELVENLTRLNALEGKIWTSEKSKKSDQNIVMNEELVKHIVVNPNIDRKVVMDLSTFKKLNNITAKQAKFIGRIFG